MGLMYYPIDKNGISVLSVVGQKVNALRRNQ